MRPRGLTGFLSSAILVMGMALLPPTLCRAESKSRKLDRVRRELEETRRQIEEYKRLEQAMGQDLKKLESQNAGTRRKMNEIERNIRRAEEKRGELKSRLGALGRASGLWKQALAGELRRHQASLASRDDAFGSSGLWGEAFVHGAALEKARSLSGLRGLGRRTELAEAQTSFAARALRQKSLTVHEEQKNRELQVREKKEALAEAEEKVAAAKAREKELEETARALTRLLRRLGKTGAYKTGAAPRLDLPKNSLSWPAAGTLVQPFGRQKNAELNTWVIHEWIRLRTAPAAAVEAVKDGRVIFSGPFRSYGQVVIVDHGADFFSVYGELGRILKAQGTKVGAGESLAEAGEDREGRAGTLYLELRRGTEAMDPLLWLKKR